MRSARKRAIRGRVLLSPCAPRAMTALADSKRTFEFLPFLVRGICVDAFKAFKAFKAFNAWNWKGVSFPRRHGDHGIRLGRREHE